MENAGISSDTKMADSPEESSWTFYIQGFMCENGDDDDRNSCFSSEYESPSLVSDAASNSAVKKLANNIGFSNRNIIGSPTKKIISKQNSFKKQKNRAMDVELEDTASSPVNSPRISNYMNQFFNQKEKNKINDASELVKRNYFAKGGVLTLEERDADYK